MRKLVAALLIAAGGGGVARAEIAELELRLSYFDQTGHGFQSSAASTSAGPGSEATWIVQPQVWLRLRDGAWTHDAVLSVDIVSSASTDALDAISSASKMNESMGIDVTSAHRGDGGTTTARYGFHLEEPLRSGFVGGGYEWNLADDNATLGLSGLVMIDSVDQVPFVGGDNYDASLRYTANLNVTASQILSPTTIADGSYGFTAQAGKLATSYNSVPLMGGGRGGEVFDGDRVRHALRGRLAQHVPATRSTLQLGYRFYGDNYGLSAHTVETDAYQYLGPWLYARLSYRLHRQSGVDFYGTAFPRMFEEIPPRTSDSDLAPFTAHELGLKLRLLGEKSPFDSLAKTLLDVAFYRYWRSNDLAVNWLGVSLGVRF